MSQTEHTASDYFAITQQIESGQIDVKRVCCKHELKVFFTFTIWVDLP